jgi:hypothetical protein
MTIRISDQGADLSGLCGSEEAEPLLAYLLAEPAGAIDWRDCDWAHTALIQVMLAAGAVPTGPARGQFLSQVLEPLLKGG